MLPPPIDGEKNTESHYQDARSAKIERSPKLQPDVETSTNLRIGLAMGFREAISQCEEERRQCHDGEECSNRNDRECRVTHEVLFQRFRLNRNVLLARGALLPVLLDPGFVALPGGGVAAAEGDGRDFGIGNRGTLGTRG